jgi:antitoxin YefM
MDTVATRTVSYSEARDRLASLWDEVVRERDALRITRRGAEAVVLVPADEYDGLVETAHLLRSPANAARLLTALERARSGEGEPKMLDELRAELERDG